ncbi:uncharacterized protein PV09_03231 [Verruconis gallopava]|uniref:Uncharacterized protein n=1 Tax=Verruconis gallopava TaxID=253628 RepID=A0A0D1YZE8_9PEZI|nr:uncharacterized protein PV09_03231 [Verruconis gallopava]KIW06057.1 hypothetical protein PV09_03231 [Verruconis gallopava]
MRCRTPWTRESVNYWKTQQDCTWVTSFYVTATSVRTHSGFVKVRRSPVKRLCCSSTMRSHWSFNSLLRNSAVATSIDNSAALSTLTLLASMYSISSLHQAAKLWS